MPVRHPGFSQCEFHVSCAFSRCEHWSEVLVPAGFFPVFRCLPTLLSASGITYGFNLHPVWSSDSLLCGLRISVLDRKCSPLAFSLVLSSESWCGKFFCSGMNRTQSGVIACMGQEEGALLHTVPSSFLPTQQAPCPPAHLPWHLLQPCRSQDLDALVCGQRVISRAVQGTPPQDQDSPGPCLPHLHPHCGAPSLGLTPPRPHCGAPSSVLTPPRPHCDAPSSVLTPLRPHCGALCSVLTPPCPHCFVIL